VEAEVIVETAVESYQFTCARCAARWTESYEVSQVTDDAGAIESLYRFHGAPCEAPIGANVACPACRSTRVRKDPLFLTPVAEVEVPGGLLIPAAPLVPRQRPRRAWGTWHRFKFSASVTMDAGVPGVEARHRKREYPSGVPGLLVRAPSWQRPSVHQYFPALFFTDDKRALRPGDTRVRAIFEVPDDDASGFFQAGQRFTLWDGADIGHGTVAQRIIWGWPELG
jgi:hypothetical protein